MRHITKTVPCAALVSVISLASLLWVSCVLISSQQSADAVAADNLFPVETSETALVRLAALGDVRSADARQAKIANLLDRISQTAPLDGVILLGDNTLLHGTPADAIKKTFLIPYAPLINRRIPFFAVLGNHDLRRGMKEYQLNFPQFNMNGRSYYERTFGGNTVEVFFLDSNNMLKDHQQILWLGRTLAQSTSTWKVIAMHHPLHTAAKDHPANARLTALIDPILVENGVDVVLAGHNHIYERLHPIKGIVYFTAGSGGKLRKGDLDSENPVLAAGYDRDNVALILEFSDTACRFLACRADGTTVDEGTFPKRHENPDGSRKNDFSVNGSFGRN